jgi:hypothetical protein
MGAVDHAISEHDVVELGERTGCWAAGTRGTVVSDYGPEVLVEVVEACGRTAGLVRVGIDRLRVSGARA